MTSTLDSLLADVSGERVTKPVTAPQLDSDPLWDVRVGETIDREDRSIWSPENGISCTAYRDRHHGQDNEWDEGGGVCSRKKHPEHWKHVAATYDSVCGVWGGEEIPVDPAEMDEADPNDVPQPGDFRKLRNRSDLLYVLRVKKDGKVAVLDLSHTSTTTYGGKTLTLPRYRELAVERVVRRKPTAKAPTPEQFAGIASWYAHMRDKERDIAVRELRTDRLSPETLATMLGELDLAPYRPAWQSPARLGIRIKVKNRTARPGRGVILDQIGQALVKLLAENPIPDIEVEYYRDNNSNPSWSNV